MLFKTFTVQLARPGFDTCARTVKPKFILGLLLATLSLSCAATPPRAPETAASAVVDSDAVNSFADAERRAFAQASPVFRRYCASCHTAPNGSGNSGIGAYVFRGHRGAAVPTAIKDVLGSSGKKPRMPIDRPGAVRGDDLAKVLAWADAAERTTTASPLEAKPH